MLEKALECLESAESEASFTRIVLAIVYGLLAIVQELVVIEGELRDLRETIGQG